MRDGIFEGGRIYTVHRTDIRVRLAAVKAGQMLFLRFNPVADYVVAIRTDDTEILNMDTVRNAMLGVYQRAKEPGGEFPEIAPAYLRNLKNFRTVRY